MVILVWDLKAIGEKKESPLFDFAIKETNRKINGENVKDDFEIAGISHRRAGFAKIKTPTPEGGHYRAIWLDFTGGLFVKGKNSSFEFTQQGFLVKFGSTIEKYKEIANSQIPSFRFSFSYDSKKNLFYYTLPSSLSPPKAGAFPIF
jgi:hypothetical protein